MQINFFTSPQDEMGILDFIQMKEGYFITDLWNSKKDRIPVLSRAEIRDLSQNREIGILSTHILMPSNNSISTLELRDEKGFTKVEVIEFDRSYQKDGIFYPGRLWLNGLKPETEKLYQSIASYIRRNFTNEDGWYLGKTANEYCVSNNLSKAVSTHR
ncbi:MAG: hypothetical protein ABJI60_02625 [Kangiellaceae bacterium]